MKDICYESRKGKYYHKCQIFVISCLEYKLPWMQQKYGQNPDISRNNIYIPYHSECKVIDHMADCLIGNFDFLEQC